MIGYGALSENARCVTSLDKINYTDFLPSRYIRDLWNQGDIVCLLVLLGSFIQRYKFVGLVRNMNILVDSD